MHRLATHVALWTHVYLSDIRALLSTEIYKPGNSAVLDKEENDKLCLMALKAELWMFYKHRRATDKEWSKKGSEVGRETTIRIMM